MGQGKRFSSSCLAVYSQRRHIALCRFFFETVSSCPSTTSLVFFFNRCSRFIPPIRTGISLSTRLELVSNFQVIYCRNSRIDSPGCIFKLLSSFLTCKFPSAMSSFRLFFLINRKKPFGVSSSPLLLFAAAVGGFSK